MQLPVINEPQDFIVNKNLSLTSKYGIDAHKSF